jgi:chemotaxis protein histidine kinase CheA
MENEKDTVTIEQAPVPTPAPVRTAESLKEAGMTTSEVESAVKLGMATKDAPANDGKEAAKTTEPSKTETIKPEAKAEVKTEPEQKQKNNTINRELSPAEEEALLKIFGEKTDVRGFYLYGKKERKARQALETKLQQAGAEIEALKAQTKTPPQADPEDEDAPLTKKALREMLASEQAQAGKATEAQKQAEFKRAIAEKEQEEDARGTLENFDQTLTLAQDLITNISTLVPEGPKRKKVVNLFKQLKYASANADKFGPDDLTGPEIAYELGTLHPNYGKVPSTPAPKADDKTDKTGTSDESPKGDGTLNPGKLERIEKNTQRRASSASVPSGGGARTLSPDEVTLEDLNNMSSRALSQFREKHADKYDKLMRG